MQFILGSKVAEEAVQILSEKKTIFTTEGTAKELKILNDKLAIITAGMTIAEASAVLLTNPCMLQRLDSISDAKLTINDSETIKICTKVDECICGKV